MLAVLILLAAPPVTVVGDVTCPTPAEVAARLGPLLPGETQSPDLAVLERVGPVLRISLSSPDGTVQGERRLEATGTCADLAAAAAVVIASFKSAIHAEFVATLPQPSRPPAVPIGAPPAARTLAVSWAVGAGGAVVVGDAAPVPAGILLGSLHHDVSGMGLRAAAMLTGEHEAALGAGRLHWSRWPLLLGPQVRLLDRLVSIDGHVQAAVGLLRLLGRGYAVDQAHASMAFGMGTGLGIKLRRRGLTPLLALDLLYWPGAETAYVESGGAEATLPRWQIAATLGIGFEWRHFR